MSLNQIKNKKKMEARSPGSNGLLVTWPDLNHARTLSRLQSLRLARLVNQYLALIPGAQDNLAPRGYLAPWYLE